MVSFSVDLDLGDISSVIQFAGSSQSELREVMDFVLGVDSSVGDLHWSLDLITELANSVAQEYTGRKLIETSIPVPLELPIPSFPGRMVPIVVTVPVPNLAKALAAIDPELAVQIFAESQELRKQEMAKIEQADECAECGHTRSLHYGPPRIGENRTGCTGPFLAECECPFFKEKEE